jgi:hypothetical protein
VLKKITIMLSIFQFVKQISSLGELFQGLSGDPGDRDGDQFLFSEASEDGLQYGLGCGPRITMPRFEMPSNVSSDVKYEGLSPAVREKDGEASHGMADIPHELFVTLAEAPQASLIHVVGLYHQVLLEHGLVQEAERIMSKLGEFQSAVDSVEAERKLQGMDLLLKDGLLKWLLAVSPLLPAIPPQVGLCLYIVLHTPHKFALNFISCLNL